MDSFQKNFILRQNFRWNLRLPLFVGLGFTLATLFLYQGLNQQETKQAQRKVSLEVENIKTEIQDGLQERMMVITQQGRRWETSVLPRLPEWAMDAQQSLQNRPGYEATAWIDAKVLQTPQTGATESVRWVVSRPGSSISVATFHHPVVENSLREAAKTKQSVISPAFILPQQKVVFVMSSPLRTEQGIEGFIVGLFDSQTFLSNRLKSNLEHGYAIRISQQGYPLFQHRNVNDLREKTWQQETSLVLPSVTWQIQTIPSQKWLKQEHSVFPEVVLGSGLSLALFLSLTLYFSLRSQQKARQLAIVNQELKKEIDDRQITEARLQHREEQLMMALEAAQMGTWDWNLLTQEIHYSEQLGPLYGLGVGESHPTYEDFLAAIHPDDRLRVDRQIQEDLKTSHDFHLEFRILWGDRSEHWLSSQGQVLRNSQGKPQRVVGVTMDITQRKQIETEIQESAEKYRLLFCSELDAISLMDGETGDFLEVNRAFLNLYGYSEAEIKHLTFQDILRPEESCPISLKNSQEGSSLNPPQIQLQIHQKKDGTYFPVEICLGRFQWTNRSVTCAVVRDVTLRVAVETQLQQTASRLAALIENLQIGVLLEDAKGQILVANQEFCNLFGIERLPQELVGLNCREVAQVCQVLFANPPGFLAGLEERLKFQEIVVSEELYLADGRVLERDYIPLFVDKNYQGHLWKYRDITTRKRTEQALQTSESSLRSFYNSSSMMMGIVELLPDDILHISDNEATAKMFGRSLEDMKDCRASELGVPPALLQLWLSHYRQCQRLQTPLSFEYQHPMSHGDRTFSVTVAPLSFHGDHPPRFSYIVEDVTERKQVEKDVRYRLDIEKIALQISTQFIDLKLEEMDAGVHQALQILGEFIQADRGYVFQFQDPGKWLEQTHSWTSPKISVSQRQFQPSSPTEMSWQMAHYESLQPLIVQRVEQLPVTASLDQQSWEAQGVKSLIGIPLVSQGKLVGFTGFESLLSHRDWGENEQQLLSLAGVVFVNLLARKRTEEALRESRHFVQRITDANPNILYLYNLEHSDFAHSYVNQEVAKILGYSPQEWQELTHQHFESLIHPDDLPLLQQRLEKLGQIPEGEIVETEYRIRHKNGQWRWLHSRDTVFSRLADGKPQQILGTAQDITERQNTQHLLQEANHNLRRWVEELEMRSREITLLSEMSDVFQACLTVEEAYNAIATLIQPLFPDMSGGVYMISPSRTLVEAVATWGDDFCSQKLFTPTDCWALRRGKFHYVADWSTGLRCQHSHDPARILNQGQELLQTGSSLCVPMMAQGEALGLLFLHAADPSALHEARQNLAVTVAEHIALALANLTLRDTLRRQSIRDPLTGLFNRRYLEESLTREIHRAERKQQSLGVMMLDVDHFKRFNDTFGHEAGDTVLRELGVFLQKFVRESDIACRYGGEELTLILPEASEEATLQRAEQIREGVKHLNLEHRRQSLGNISISFGVACFPQHGLTGEALIQAADRALYQAKMQGRDRVVLAH